MFLAAARFAMLRGRPARALYYLRRTIAVSPKPHIPFTAPQPKMKNGHRPELSVIIPTLNRAESLRRCLASICRQSLNADRYEVLVIDNGSSDHTAGVCREFARTMRHLHYKKEPVPGLLAARHAGWREAGADILTFCDDDIEALPTWLETVLSLFRKYPDADLVGGNNLPAFDALPPPPWAELSWREDCGVEFNGYFSFIRGVTGEQKVKPWLVFGCNYSIRRKRLELVRGFEPDITPCIYFQGGGETGIYCFSGAPAPQAILADNASVTHHMPPQRLTDGYMYNRGAYMMISELYSYLRGRGRQDSPPEYLDRYRPADIGLRRAHEGKLYAYAAYTRAVLKSPTLRAWIGMPHYFGYEKQPGSTGIIDKSRYWE